MSENKIKSENKISVQEFVDKYKACDFLDKNTYVCSIINRYYVPVLEKKLVLETLLNKCVVKGDNGVMYIDMFLNKINLFTAIMILYTDLNVIKNDSNLSNTFSDYDLLEENGLITLITDSIGNDINNLIEINNILIEQWNQSYSSTAAFIGRVSNSFSVTLGSFLKSGFEQFKNIVGNDSKIKEIIKSI
jgi:hypothetical protein